MKNALENIPNEMIGGKSTILQIFRELATSEGRTEESANTMESILPNELKVATVWLDKLTNIWRYGYGTSIDNLQSGYVWGGTTNHFPVENLYLAIKIAYENLTKDQFKDYINRLKDITKHSDVLFEMRPLINVSKIFKKYFEIQGYGIGHTTLDWRINLFGYNIVFDVKNRIKSLITHLEEITPYMEANANNIIPPAPDPKDLFKSAENKLIERNFINQLQGVWIQTQIKEHKSALNNYFHNGLNPKKIHFMIISDWKEDAYILTRNKFIKYILKKLFHIKESERHVTEEYL